MPATLSLCMVDADDAYEPRRLERHVGYLSSAMRPSMSC